MGSTWRSAVVVVGLVAGAMAQAPVLDQVVLLQRLVDLDWLWQPPVAGERCVQWSSYDRASAKGPTDPGAWYANDDRGHYLRVVEREGRREFVLAETSGPGCIARLWSANPQGTLHFDLDGERVWSVDFAQLLSGQVQGVPEPIAGMRSKGGNCHLPIPFGKSLVLSCTSGECYYAVDVVRWPAGTRVATFTPAGLATLGAGERMVTATQRIGPYDTGVWLPAAKVAVPQGQLVVKVEVELPPALPRADQVEVLRHTLLVVCAGDEETVRVPVADFFALGSLASPYAGRCLAVTAERAICTFPMPMPEGGSLDLVAESPYGAMAAKFHRVQTQPLAEAAALRFRASYQLAKAVPTRPFSDHLVLDAKGQGRFVGCSLLVRNPSRIWWGEGDEKFTVDGEAFPSWFGTGTEDYFGYAWCDPTPFQSPFHAQIECQGPMNYGFTQLHRTHLLDAVPFQQSFRFELERWHWVEDIAVDYATVAYWYGAAGATSGLPPVPAAADRELPKLGPPPMFVAEGAIEGEDLRVLACPSGAHEKQGMWWLEKVFSKDGQLWWRDGTPGSAIVLALPVKEPGRYRVSAAFAQADDYGIVQVSLAGKLLGAPFDGYAERVRSSGPQVLGVVELPAGDAELRLQLTGRHDQAKPRFMVGLDYVRLEKLP